MDQQTAAHSSSSTLSAGSRLGSYEILQRIGSGGMGEVYRARDTRLGREVAIKTVSMQHNSRPEAVSRFEQEARSASALNHPNIVTIYELGQADGTRYIAMELVAGETLREMLAAGPLAFRRAVVIAAQIADALAKAHEVGIVHRDLKPDNVMVSAEGTAKILDFGLAKLLFNDKDKSEAASTAVPITTEGTVMGTMGYMSPEQANGEDADFHSDQFSFGAVLFEMVTGTPAFRKDTTAKTAAAILRDETDHIIAKMVDAPSPFVWIVERCLAKDPKQRYASTRDLARDLAAVRDRLGDAAGRHTEQRPNNLPVQRTAFIGRQGEASSLRQLLERSEVRLVTLTGPGGIGKTRLALHVASELADQHPNGVYFVALSRLNDPSLLASTVGQVIGVRESGGQSPQESLNAHLAALSRPMLLLLDNFEHLLTAAADVSDLLSASPHLKIVVTSQAALHVYGEHEFPVPPLAVPDASALSAPEELSRLPAIALFVERAKAVKHDFMLNKENAAAVVAICGRLDGLPLAIELAAARVKLLSPAAMLARLESSLNLLTGGARDLPSRQQTLRATVDWSFNLLNPAEQTIFRRLAVFVGGCTLDGVEAVCDTRGDLGLDVLDGMASMVDKSLVQQVELAEQETRFVMLSTIREYALERLRASDEEPATRRAHAAYYLVLAEEGTKAMAGEPQWLERFDLEHHNFRAAIDHLANNNEAEWGMRLGAALFRFWETREHLSEGRETSARLLAMQGTRELPRLRARLLFSAAVLAGEQGDYAASRELCEESLELCLEQKDNRGVAVALNALGVNARDRGDLQMSALLFERCVAIWKDLGDTADIGRALSNLANVINMQGDQERAFSLYDECLTMFRAAGDGAGVAWTLNYQGDIARERGDCTAARVLYEESLAAFQQLRDGWGIASTLSDLASLHCDQGQTETARDIYRQSIKIFQELGHQRGVASVLECLAASAVAHSKPEHALHLAGAAAALRQRLGAPLTPSEQLRLEKALAFARRTVGNASSLSAWMEGWTMPVQQAIRQAFSDEMPQPARNSA